MKTFVISDVWYARAFRKTIDLASDLSNGYEGLYARFSSWCAEFSFTDTFRVFNEDGSTDVVGSIIMGIPAGLSLVSRGLYHGLGAVLITAYSLVLTTGAFVLEGGLFLVTLPFNGLHRAIRGIRNWWANRETSAPAVEAPAAA